MRPILLAPAFLTASLATADLCRASPNTFIFEVSNIVSPERPSATVTLWAAFEPQWYAFNETRTEVFTEFDRGWFSDPTAILDPWGHSEEGEVSGDGGRVSGIYIMQIYFPLSILPEEGNPIPLWSAAWTTDDFTPRRVGLGTQTESYWLYTTDKGAFDQVGVNFEEGSGFIAVVPAPPVALIVASAGGVGLRRCRRGSAPIT